jgi:TRAP-type C4-dicarboxylate transport system substrate-binding protein
VSATQAYDSAVKGVIDVANVVPGWTMGKFPLSDAMAFPLGLPDGVTASKIGNEYYAKFRPAEFDEVKVMYFHVMGPGILHSKKPIHKLEDLKGMKIRAFGPMVQWCTDLGAVPIGMPMGEAYDALSKGLVEGIFAPYEVLVGYKLGEVVKYHIENLRSSYHGVQVVVMNKAKWNSLPPDIQKTIEAINVEFAEKQGKMWDQIDKEGKDYAIKNGHTIIRLSPDEDERWLAKAKNIYDDYIKRMKAKGLPGEEVVKFYREKANLYRK